MKTNLHKLKTKHKLLLGFSAIIIILAIGGHQIYYTIDKFQEIQQTKSERENLEDQIIQLKYFLRSEMELLRQLQNTEKTSDIKKNKIAQQHFNNSFQDNLLSIINITDSLNSESDSINLKINKKAQLIFDTYQKQINLPFVSVFDYKKEILENQSISERNSFAETDSSENVDSIAIESMGAASNPDENYLMINYTSTVRDLSKNAKSLLVSLEELSLLAKENVEAITKYAADYASTTKKLIIVILIISLLLSISLAIFTTNSISQPLKHLTNYIQILAKGNLPDEYHVHNQDEIGIMTNAINKLNRNLKETREFANEVGQGKFDTNIHVFNNQGDLGTALSEMRKRLFKVAREREKQIFKENQRNWTTRGLAQFADILRQDIDDMDKLSHNIIVNLVNYLDAIQGGLYLINDDDEDEIHIEMVACFAYNRKKSMKKVFNPKEGLIGRCIDESETIYLTEIPQSYVNITSGLGKSNPESLLIVPLKLNEEIYGAVEIASFNTFESYHIEFVEKLGENIASTLSSVKVSARTAKLLEQAQENAEEMAAQEEELRQNLEEMQATQEEADRKEREAIAFTTTVNHTVIRAEYDTKGRLLYANSRFMEVMEYTTREIEGESLLLFHIPEDLQQFKNVLETISKGGKHFEGHVQFKTKTGHIWLLASYTAVRNEEGGVDKILFLAFEVEKKMSELHQANIRIKELEDTIENLEDKIYVLRHKYENIEKENKKQ